MFVCLVVFQFCHRLIFFQINYKNIFQEIDQRGPGRDFRDTAILAKKLKGCGIFFVYVGTRICSGYSKEPCQDGPSQRDGSLENSKHNYVKTDR